jgi:hypothetical protein
MDFFIEMMYDTKNHFGYKIELNTQKLYFYT